ncbi:MAG: bifunctional nicotinamidase/pyrazinamidase [Bacteroidales bacterium]|jgi:nicotinamidase/pyrazinamidase|nr:bifunctional nicotinamidase/pyrazinamidase [Bacteroidales bacterium]MDD4383690.1 bifunctional nicotinamidase/pyrazinamidase [Bacteroidales bacterium]MDY0196221.1 bifunctional nicotinamidase/pyrazinamidase [Tenuifilaceae bacterium]
MKTLIIIDVQNDFMPGGSLAIRNGNAIVPVINSIQEKFDLVVATLDWHPIAHASFASNHPGKKEFDTIKLNGLEQVLWPNHCVQNTRGADFHSDLKTNRIAAIFRKGMNIEIDSYSGFYDNGHLKSTGLAGYLKELKANDLYFCGLAADICVYFSLLDALKEGFNATLIEDASRPLSESDFDKIKDDLISKGAKIINSNTL